jgi:tetratricopeptide (TPR) repeat protein
LVATTGLLAVLVVVGGLFSVQGRGVGELPSPGALPGSAIRAAVNPLVGFGVAPDQVGYLQQLVRARPDDPEANARLGIAYLQRARATGDPSYYPKAETLLGHARRLAPANLDAVLGLGSLALSRHDFHRALTLGQAALELANGYSASASAILGDAEIELGQYPAAFRTMDELGRQHPSLVAYTRQSYAAELRGDLRSATDLMHRAVIAGAGAGEATQWTRVQYAALLLRQGELASAETEYEHALAALPDYARAEAGLGAVAVAHGDLAAAERWLTTASDHLPLPEIVTLLGDVQTARGETEAAARSYGVVRVEQRLFAAAGGNVDLEVALFDANHPASGAPTIAETITLARHALAERPSIYAHDALAWALYRAGDCGLALPEARAAAALGTTDAELAWHLGAIAACTGDRRTAVAALRRALHANPRFHPLDAPAARTLLTRLETR